MKKKTHARNNSKLHETHQYNKITPAHYDHCKGTKPDVNKY